MNRLTTSDEVARLLLHDIEAALAAGTRHFAQDGRELVTVLEVLQELLDHGAVRLQIPEEAT